MTQGRFHRIRDLFDVALTHAPDTRTDFVAEACGDDTDLYQQVQKLLKAHQEGSGVIDVPDIARQMGVVPLRREGTQVGQYDVLRELGRGGMGEVFLARTRGSDPSARVAIKILRSDVAGPEVLHRFQQERRILGLLAHPNIGRVFDAGMTADGLPFFVMEFVDGQRIDKYCDNLRLSIPDRLSLFRQVCAAVQCAHAHGIVHRDIKPSNILVTASGLVKLLDFGIAKVMKTEATATTLWMTAEGLRPMTPEYASPEQIREEPVSPATDVYSLGVVLYELLTGHRPYRLKNRVFHEILRVICEEEPTLPSVVVEFPPEAPGSVPHATPDANVKLRQTTSDGLRQALRGNLDSILIRALEKQPRKRYATAEQLDQDIARHLGGELVQAGSVQYSRISKILSRHRGWVITGLFIAAAVASGGISVSWPTVWAASAALTALLAWNIATDKDLARTVATGPFWGILNVVMAVAFFISVFVLDAVAGFLYGSGAGPHRDFRTGELKLFWCIPLTLTFGRWLLRSRWGGGLVLNASRRRNVGFAVVAAIAFIYIPLRLTGIIASHLPAEQSAGFALLFNTVDVLLWAFLYALSGRVEFRQYGVITAGGFYRWTRIESFEWRESTYTHAVLQLNMSGRHAALPAVRLRIPLTRRSEAEAVMTRFLSEWPRLESSTR